MPSKPKRYRPGRTEVRLRREKVAYLWPQMPDASAVLSEIKKDPFFKDKPVDLSDIYNDISYAQKHAGEYIALEFLPQLGWHFENTVKLLQMIVAESCRRYREGETETQMRESDRGTVNTVIHREGGAQWLALAGSAQQAIMKIAEHGPVTKEAHRVMQDYKRLLELEKKGALPLAIEHRPAN